MIAAEKIPFTGYHMPFPNVGYVEPLGPGFRYVSRSSSTNSASGSTRRSESPCS